MKQLKDYIPFRRLLKDWFVRTYQMKRKVRKQLAHFYSADMPLSTAVGPMVVCMADGKILHGGLADRLRSYTTHYAYCKEHGMRFAINFTFPFRLEDYLVPNSYDWTLAPGELTFNSTQAKPVIFKASGSLDRRERKCQRRLSEKYLVPQGDVQYHLYSNFSYDDERFGEFFNELFRPSPRIEAILDKCRGELGSGYISVSTRFLELLGDFKEPKTKLHLSPEEQQRLIDKCKEEVEELHRQYPHVKMLLTSDSKRFLDACARLPYVYIAEGTIEHIDVKSTGADHTKTFVDFLLIAGAEKVFQIKCGPMFSGNFSLRAAQAGSRPHKLITLP